MCCCDEHQTKGIFPQREKICRKFVISSQEGLTRSFYVNISQFQVENQEIALCRILLTLDAKGLITNNRKFYMPKFNSIIQPKSFCRIKIFSLNERDVILKSYPKSKDNQEIFRQNAQFETPIVLFNPKVFRPVATSGSQFFSMNDDKFNSTQNFKADLESEECPCIGSNLCVAKTTCMFGNCCPPCDFQQGQCEQRSIQNVKKQPNVEIQNSFLYLQQQIKNQIIEAPSIKNEIVQMVQQKSSSSGPNQLKMKRESKEKKMANIKSSIKQQQGNEKKNQGKVYLKNEGKSSSHLQSKEEMVNQNKIKQSPVKRTRQPQRNIAEVILMTKIWRQLHQIKSWSLIEGAKLVGISKKSLDDYYLILRQGVLYGYDFAGNLSHGMGELRSFLKEKEVKAIGKLQKHVECFNLVPELNLDLLIDQYRSGESITLLQ